MDDVDAVRARMNAASLGEWTRHGADVHVEGAATPLFTGRDGDAVIREQADRDADFVAHARDDIRTLLALLDPPPASAGRHLAPE